MPGARAIDDEVRTHLVAGETTDATTLVIRSHGAEIMGLLVALSRDDQTAADAYALWCERLWSALPGFRFEASVRTFAYVLARRSLSDQRRAQHKHRHVVPVSPSKLPEAVVQARTATCTFRRTSVKDELLALREDLSQDDRMLLALRLDREMAWRDIARVIADEGATGEGATGEDELERTVLRLRKRFQRLKTQLTAALRAQRRRGDE